MYWTRELICADLFCFIFQLEWTKLDEITWNIKLLLLIKKKPASSIYIQVWIWKPIYLIEWYITEIHIIAHKNLVTRPESWFSCYSPIFSELNKDSWFTFGSFADSTKWNEKLLKIYQLNIEKFVDLRNHWLWNKYHVNLNQT